MLFLQLFFSACGSEKGGQTQTFENTTPNAEVSLGQIEGNLTFDLLGGVFAKRSKEIENQIIGKGETNPEKNVLYQTISTAPEGDTTDPLEETHFVIDVGFNFNGKGGHGKMALSATGEGISYSEKSSEEPKILHFSPLNLQFSFHNYAFDSTCVEDVKLDGIIDCKIEGDYEVDKNKFLGEAICQSAPHNESIFIVYRTPFKDYWITFNATLKIDGNPYRYDSYSYTGDIIIDGESKKIESLVSQSGRCSK